MTVEEEGGITMFYSYNGNAKTCFTSERRRELMQYIITRLTGDDNRRALIARDPEFLDGWCASAITELESRYFQDEDINFEAWSKSLAFRFDADFAYDHGCRVVRPAV